MSSAGSAKLDALVAEAIVDCYDDEEQLTGLYTMLNEHLVVPFTTQVLGVEVTVVRVELRRNGIVAICHRDGLRQAIEVLDVSLPQSPPAGAEWIEAYRHWAA